MEIHNMVSQRGVGTGREHVAGEVQNFGCETHVLIKPLWISLVNITASHHHLIAGLKCHFTVAPCEN